MLSFFLRDVLDEIWDLIESVSGRVFLSSLLYDETGWETLESHRHKHKLVLVL